MLVAGVLGWWWGVQPFSRMEWTAGGLVAGAAATAPLLVGLWWCLRSRWPPIRRLIRLVEERVGPLFAGAGVGELALVAALAGVGEEVLFRGVIQEALAGRLPGWAAILAAGLLFGAAHWVSLTYAVLAATVGCYLGALYHLTGTLAAPVVTHASYDLVALLVLARMKPGVGPSGVQEAALSASFHAVPTARSPTWEERMSAVDTYTPGRFCWVDLGTTDPVGAKKFYTGLFGWTYDDRPMGDGASYTMLLLDGKSVAALYQQDPQQQGMGIPPAWLSYIAVERADDVADRARRLGGTVLLEPFDVLDVGRMAVIQDPTGAVVALWEGRRHRGAELIEEPNTLAWNELATGDVAKAGPFYAGLLGWELEPQQYGPLAYTLFRQGERANGGMMAIQPEWGPVPPHWLAYFAVKDCDATASRAQQLGATLLMPPTDIPTVGRFATIRDPQGAAFAVISMASG